MSDYLEWVANTAHLNLWVSFNGGMPRLETNTCEFVCSPDVIELHGDMQEIQNTPVAPRIQSERRRFLQGREEVFTGMHVYSIQLLRGVDPDSLSAVFAPDDDGDVPMAFLPRIYKNGIVFGRGLDALGETTKQISILLTFKWVSWEDRVRKLCSDA